MEMTLRNLLAAVAAVAAVATVAATLFAAAGATAKSTVQLRVSSHAVPVGRSVVIRASGLDDGAGLFQIVCVQLRMDRRWRNLRCSSAVGPGSSATPAVTVALRERVASVVEVRAELLQSDLRDGRRIPDNVTGVQTVRFRQMRPDGRRRRG